MPMLLLDSAQLSDIENLIKSDAIAGVTTNPSLMAKTAPGDYLEQLQQIAALVGEEKHLSVEVTTLDVQEMKRQALELHDALCEKVDLYIKVPVMMQTLPLITHLSKEEGVKVNATACMTAAQAQLAAEAHADIVSFFFNRMLDGLSKNEFERPEKRPVALGEISTFKELGHTDVICGSIRTPQDVVDCWINGSDYVTAPMKVIKEIIEHPKTVEAIKQFDEDFKRWQS